jgi:heme/copper-type cytochrome/quinol oxidase subunit 2
MHTLASISRRARRCLMTSAFLLFAMTLYGQTRTIEILADRDSRFKMNGKSDPQITLKAGETVLWRVTAVKGKSWNRDGVIHGFTLIRLKDRIKVPGWNLELKAGVQEFTLVAPSEPGEYEILCTVICSEEHEGMWMKVLVTS